jgi:hypothetical protein
MISTLDHRLADADLCRANGWGPGTRLRGQQGRHTATITITAVGRSSILAIEDDGCYEHPWTLRDRDWRVVQ